MNKTESTPEHLHCGWCGRTCSSLKNKIIHEDECEVAAEEQQKEIERQELHRMENQFWYGEHLAGRI